VDRNFLGLEAPWCELESANVVVVPIPYEHTTSYGKGTAKAPEAILGASRMVELYDEEVKGEAYRWMGGIATLEPLIQSEAMVDADAVHHIRNAVDEILDREKIVISIGGEHTVALGCVSAFASRYPGMSVLQFDAHSDLRDEYEGNPYSHACVMKRILDGKIDIVQVGIRSQCQEEAHLIEKRNLATFLMSDMKKQDDWMSQALARLGDPVYITFDCDCLDPALMPAVGTPEPGGMNWDETTAFLRRVMRERRVVGLDLCELAPIPGYDYPQFTAARLLYKVICYQAETQCGKA